MGVAAADDEREGWQFDGRTFLGGFQDDSVDVAFNVVHRDEGLAGGEGDGLGVREAHEQCTCETGAVGCRDGIEIRIVEAGGFHCFTNHRNDGAEVFAGGQLRDYPAVFRMNGELA